MLIIGIYFLTCSGYICSLFNVFANLSLSTIAIFAREFFKNWLFYTNIILDELAFSR